LLQEIQVHLFPAGHSDGRAALGLVAPAGRCAAGQAGRAGGTVLQQVVAPRGASTSSPAPAALAALLASSARFCEQVMLLSALDHPEHEPRLQARRIGAPLVFGRL